VTLASDIARLKHSLAEPDCGCRYCHDGGSLKVALVDVDHPLAPAEVAALVDRCPICGRTAAHFGRPTLIRIIRPARVP
jgi:hypothetical protein